MLLLLILFAALSARSRRARTKKAERLAAEGARVPGVVTEVVPFASMVMKDPPMLSFTVQFRDHFGSDRRVTRQDSFPTGTAPRPGDPAIVTYDPAETSEGKNVSVSLTRNDLPGTGDAYPGSTSG